MYTATENNQSAQICGSSLVYASFNSCKTVGSNSDTVG